MMPHRILIRTTLALFAAAAIQPADAVILFGLDNSANKTDPGTGVPFNGVALVANSMANPRGSAIHLGGGYMLTANHVETVASVTFDGSTFLPRDLSFIPVQVAAGVDLKIFKLESTPAVAPASVYGGSGEMVAPATMIGWGRGRLATVPVNSAAVTWGGIDTIARRWGLNVPRAADVIEYSYGGFDYSYEALITVLGGSSGDPAGLGASEGALTQYDSGSGLFQYIGGAWQLIGIATTVDTNGTSNFGDDDFGVDGGDGNYYVRLGDYQSQILTIIPEPSTGLLAAGALFLLMRRRVPRH